MSSGCRSHSLPPAWPTIVSGGVADLKGLPSQRRPSRLSLPSTYGTTKRPAPLLIHFHGWAGTLESGMVFHSHGIHNGYLVASPLGFDDEGTQPASWNGAGTSGTSGRTCYDPTGAYASLRYSRSCHASPVNGTSCGWATCEDSVMQTQELLDELDRAVCFDPQRVYATGVSNGGIFLYELAASRLSTRFAGFMPLVGSPHRGFNRPHVGGPVPFFGLWGRNDDTVPPLPNPQARGHPGDPDVSVDTHYKSGGWYFTSASAVTRTWAKANGCSDTVPTLASCNSSTACVTSVAGGASCVGYREGCGTHGVVLHCLHTGGHEVPVWAADALWSFMKEHAREPVPSPPPTPPPPMPTLQGRLAAAVSMPRRDLAAAGFFSAVLLAASLLLCRPLHGSRSAGARRKTTKRERLAMYKSSQPVDV